MNTNQATSVTHAPDNLQCGALSVALGSADRERHEIICQTARCAWAGDLDDTLLSKALTGFRVVECDEDDPAGEACCPRCLLTNLVETKGWDDSQLPERAFKPNA